MKNLRFSFLLFIILPITTFAQWSQIPSGTSSFLVDLSFINSDVGWVIGHDSTILKTTNAGQDWIPQQPGNTDDVLSVYFFSELTGWIGTSSGLIYKTTDGGNSWYLQYNALNKWITKIYFINETTGFATIHKYSVDSYYREGAIIKTTDSGETWSVKTQIYQAGFQCIYFPDDINGYAVGSSGLFSRTTDGGETWSYPISLTAHWFHTMFFIDKDTGFAAGGGFNNDLIFRTTNSGSSWTLVRNSFEGGILGLTFLDSQRGWACGYNGLILRTTNGGLNWGPETSGINSAIGEMVLFDSSGFAVGEYGMVLKYSYQSVHTYIALIQPNNGEIINTGSSYEILWNSQNVGDVKLELSIDDGQNWTSIIDSVPSTGAYTWTVPDIFSTECRIKISDITNLDIYDISIGNFTILSSKTINLIKPNGGEILVAGSNYEINWNSNDVEYVKIEFSSDSGVNWISIIDSVLSTCTYTWTVPDIFSTQCRIKISDITNLDVYDISNGNFTIQSSITMINVTKPNGGEILLVGGNYEINWNSNDVEYVKIEYSVDNGASWDVITDSTQSDGIHPWNVPNIQTIQGIVKISNIAQSAIFDISDNPFRIDFFVNVNDVSDVLDYGLSQNYPNPFNPITKIEYSILEHSCVTLRVYDALGNLVSTLVSEDKPAGNYSVEFNATDLPSGVYLYKIIAGDFVSVKKMLLLK